LSFLDNKSREVAIVLHVAPVVGLPLLGESSEVHAFLFAANDDLVVDIGDVFDEEDVVLEVFSENVHDHVHRAVSARVAHM